MIMTITNSCIFLLQISLLPECVHSELLVCMVGLVEMGERDRLDGSQWD